jgi:hypothetical protein
MVRIVALEGGAAGIAGDAPVVGTPGGLIHGKVVLFKDGRHIVGRGVVDDELGEFCSVALQLASVRVEQRDAKRVMEEDGTSLGEVDAGGHEDNFEHECTLTEAVVSMPPAKPVSRAAVVRKPKRRGERLG